MFNTIRLTAVTPTLTVITNSQTVNALRFLPNSKQAKQFQRVKNEGLKSRKLSTH